MMTKKCEKCGKEKIPYITDPDIIEWFCSNCDDIPGGAKVDSSYTMMGFVTKKKESN